MRERQRPKENPLYWPFSRCCGRFPAIPTFSGICFYGMLASHCIFRDASTKSLTVIDPSLIFNCITFGSPPLCNSDFASLVSQFRLKNENCHLHVNFLNEFDLVPRLDRSYVLSLIDLYRSRFSLPPIKSDGSTDSSLASTALTMVANAPDAWPLPAPVFVHPGDTVLLSHDEEMDHEDETIHLRATHIDSDALGSLLFCRVAAHKVAVYLANMEALCAGNLKR